MDIDRRFAFDYNKMPDDSMTIEEIAALVRPNVLKLSPYSSARDEFKGEAHIFLDANENPFDSGLNRYPDPHQTILKGLLAPRKGVASESIFLGNGSDEAIDLLIRTFCIPGKNEILITPPTYGMYKVSADINDVKIVECSLTESFELDAEQLLKKVGSNTRIIFLCSPNNPSGNLLSNKQLELVLTGFQGIVVIDEAYIDFAGRPSWISRLKEFPNLVVLQTLSKAWGLANLRVGMAFAHPFIVGLLNKMKPPYNINGVSQRLAAEALESDDKLSDIVKVIIHERSLLSAELQLLPNVVKVYPSDANFLLVKMKAAHSVYSALLAKGVVVRDRSNVRLCDDCLRITVGTSSENKELLSTLRTL